MCRAAISTMSLGYAVAHDFETKIKHAAQHSIRGLEIFYADLEALARQLHGSTDWSALLDAAERMHDIITAHGMEVVNLQPFSQYEGLLDRAAHSESICKAQWWFQYAKALHTDFISIPANFLDKTLISSDMDLIVADLTELVDLGAKHGMRFSFEALAWSTYLDTWEQTWEVVRRVNRPNFGLCLDTFNIAGRVYADPSAPSGKTQNADADMKASLARLASTVDVEKIFLIQVVDGERLKSPLSPEHEYWNEEQPERMMWSRNGRLFYGETERGAYLPVKQILDVVIGQLGYRGWVSLPELLLLLVLWVLTFGDTGLDGVLQQCA